jgi:hypothetical protein
MALCQITCPHCEKEVELDVTSVTRSRDCPNCGKSILLELTTRQKRSRRTALVVPSVDAVEALGQASHAERAGPQPLEGDVFDRMMHDPEVRQNLRRLIWGTGILIGVIVLLCVLDRIEWSSWSAQDLPSSAPDASAPGVASDPTSLERPEPEPLVAKATLPPAPSAPLSPPPAPVAIPAPPSTEAAPAAVRAKPPVSDEERAMETVRSFLSAKNVDERLLTVRSLQRMEPIIRAYYVGHPDGPIPFTQITPEPVVSRGSPIRKFQVELPGGERRRATAGRLKSGDYRVDWASFVIRSEMDWDDFMQKRPSEPVFMRVFMAPAPSASPEFPASNYLCVKLTNPLNAASPPIYGYAGRDSALEKSLNLLLRLYADEPFSVRLTLRHPAHTQGTTGSNDQVMIEQFVGEGWLSTAEEDFR